MGVNRKAEKWDQLDRGLAGLAGMAAAAAVGCSFCLDLNYFMAHNRGLDEGKAREVPIWRESSVYTPLERRVMEYADAMSQTPPAVSDELSAELLEELGAPALRRAGRPRRTHEHRGAHEHRARHPLGRVLRRLRSAPDGDAGGRRRLARHEHRERSRRPRTRS